MAKLASKSRARPAVTSLEASLILIPVTGASRLYGTDPDDAPSNRRSELRHIARTRKCEEMGLRSANSGEPPERFDRPLKPRLDDDRSPSAGRDGTDDGGDRTRDVVDWPQGR